MCCFPVIVNPTPKMFSFMDKPNLVAKCDLFTHREKQDIEILGQYVHHSNENEMKENERLEAFYLQSTLH